MWRVAEEQARLVRLGKRRMGTKSCNTSLATSVWQGRSCTVTADRLRQSDPTLGLGGVVAQGSGFAARVAPAVSPPHCGCDAPLVRGTGIQPFNGQWFSRSSQLKINPAQN